jgi:hypothetical protein
LDVISTDAGGHDSHTAIVVVDGQCADDVRRRLEELSRVYDEAQRSILTLMATDNYRRFKKTLLPANSAPRYSRKAGLDKDIQ